MTDTARTDAVPIRDSAELIAGEDLTAHLTPLATSQFRKVLVERHIKFGRPRIEVHRVYVYTYTRNSPYIIGMTRGDVPKEWTELKSCIRWIEKNLPHARRIVMELEPQP